VAQRAIPSGTTRRRTAFGLLDADGWAAAFWKGMFWFATVLFLLGYLPNIALYLTIRETVQIGYNVISVVNLCDAANGDLPCPVPAGAVVPWQASPPEVALPEGRADAGAFQGGLDLYLVGGTGPTGPTASVLKTTTTEDGNFGPWSEGAPLPEPRTDAAFVAVNGRPFVIGGLDAEGAPTTTVYAATLEEGAVTGWEELEALSLKAPVSGAMAVATTSGIYLMGGAGADGLSASTWQAGIKPDSDPPELVPWVERPELTLPDATGQPNGRAHAAAGLIGDGIYVVGGETTLGPTGDVLRLHLDDEGNPVRSGEAPDAPIVPWAVSLGASSLPAARVDAAGFTNGGAIYVVGGHDGTGTPVATTYWAVPEATTGDIAAWQTLSQDDLPSARVAGSAAVVGAHAYVVGGADSAGPLTDTLRANLAPKAPFFQLGLIGATVPGLAIPGAIGIQLAELNASLVATGAFVVLIALAVLLQRPRLRGRLLHTLSRGRTKAPTPEDDY
jgi:hypothetical protein